MFGKRFARLAVPLLALATSVTALAASVTAGAQETPSASARAYVETSYAIAPKAAGDFTLEQSTYDPQQKYAGAGFRYTVPGHQETRIDVYVYPAGKLDRATALSSGMEGFRADLQRALDAGIYTDLQLDDDQAFMLAEADDAPPPAKRRTRRRDDDIAGVLAAVLQANLPVGRELPMRMNLQPQDWPMHSVGYLFYKNLYYIKVRASAAQSRISAESFDTLTDRAARTLVPAIDVANIGDCANSVIHVAQDASANEIAKALVTQSAEHQLDNCHLDADDAGIAGKSADAEVVVIGFDPGEWTSK